MKTTIALLLTLASAIVLASTAPAREPAPHRGKGISIIEPARGSTRALYEIYGATLIDNAYMDGDSFTVRLPNGERVIFRLYYVDTPETDTRYPDRLRDQAKAHGLRSIADTLELGEKAKAYTRKMLTTHRFTIYTNWRKSLGQSETQRYYAMIWLHTNPKEDTGSFLSENLIAKRYARIHGHQLDSKSMPAKEFIKSLTAEQKKAHLARR